MTMLTWYPVIRFPIATNLKPLLNHLGTINISARVTEERGEQQIWIAEQEQVLFVAELSTRWFEGDLELNEAPEPITSNGDDRQSTNFRISAFLYFAKRLPVTISIILCGIIGTILISLDGRQLSFAEPFLFQGLSNNYFVPLADSLAAGEYWRLITPTFIHFGFLHILFNSLILWEVGRRIELAKGSLHYMGFILLVSVISNISQYSVMNNTVFGGLSGVVYGVIGYIAVYQEFIKHPILQFNKPTIAFFLLWLLLGVFGVIDLFIQGSIANAAHISGLLTGVVFGGLMVFIDKKPKDNDVNS